MKSERSIGKARNARLNRARSACGKMLDRLKTIEGTPWDKIISDADFWQDCRSLAFDLTQALHEANAYNNCMAPDGTSFEQDEYEAK